MARRASDAERKVIKTRVKTNIIDEGLNVFFHPMFYTRREAYDILQKLEAEIVYDSPEDSSVIINGERQNIRRQHVAHGDEGLVYTFCERTMDTRAWTPVLAKVRDDIEKALGLRFNFCLVNRYRNGLDRIGAHMDDEEDLDPNASIIGISFGTPRDFLLRHHTLQHPNKPAQTKKPKFGLYKVTLPSGSLIQMKTPTNNFWYHEIPAKATAGKNPRISLTFRMMKMRGKDFVEEKRNEDYITNFLKRDSRSTGRTIDESQSSAMSTPIAEARKVQSPWQQQEGISSPDKYSRSSNENVSTKKDWRSHFPHSASMVAEPSAKSSRFSRFPSNARERTGYPTPKRKTQTSKRRTPPSQQRLEKPQYQE